MRSDRAKFKESMQKMGFRVAFSPSGAPFGVKTSKAGKKSTQGDHNVETTK
ncbi:MULTISPECIES: hypothetical protein [Campylobacter]|uniref:hypothetical protein n=1 Tax=Campylobacter TaxID=194 RepID=UPI0014700C85|nr:MULTISPECIES: hypothetical protein [Campylobacter]MBN7287564.1 hypothetical protein [Campylobacter curvus]MDU6826569.1 hypothetical protein [Campylobacter sp.]